MKGIVREIKVIMQHRMNIMNLLTFLHKFAQNSPKWTKIGPKGPKILKN